MSKTQINLAEFKRSWRILLLSVLGIAISINAVLLYGFGTLVGPFEENFGWSRSAQQAAITFLYGGAVIGLQAVGWLNVRFGIQRVTVISLLLMATGYLACTQFIGGSIWTLYLAFALLPIIGMGALAVTWTQLINLWFVENRGLALAIGLSGTGITAAVTPNIMAWSIETFSWQAPFVLLAGVNLLLIPLSLLWFHLPQSKPLVSGKARGDSEHLLPVDGVSFREGFTAPKFWICNLALCLVVSAVVGLVTNTIPILQDAGFASSEAAFIFSFFGVSLIAGRMVVGYLLDRLWPPGVAACSLVLPALGCLVLLSGADSFVLLAIAVALFGLGAGAEFDIAAFLIARYFGLADYGRLFGFHQGLITVASSLAPLMFAVMYSQSGGYDLMLFYCTAATLLGPLLLLWLGRPPQFGARPALA
ncbi:MAG: MFS transporter [Gammaproteobacteria bacterium]|nr:MFS transporter [Gammaproteobacteria bacterium]